MQSYTRGCLQAAVEANNDFTILRNFCLYFAKYINYNAISDLRSLLRNLDEKLFPASCMYILRDIQAYHSGINLGTLPLFKPSKSNTRNVPIVMGSYRKINAINLITPVLTTTDRAVRRKFQTTHPQPLKCSGDVDG